MQVADFIYEHKVVNQYTNYCEALIYPNGEIEYAIPAHLYKLQALFLGVDPIRMQTDVSLQEEICRQLPLECAPLHYLVDKLGVVSVWYNSLLCPTSITENQISTINKLLSEEILCNAQLYLIVTVEEKRYKLMTKSKNPETTVLYLQRKKDRILRKIKSNLKNVRKIVV